jgi:hypothetical protein
MGWGIGGEGCEEWDMRGGKCGISRELVGNEVGAMGKGGWEMGESEGNWWGKGWRKGWEGLEDSLELFHRTRRQQQLNGLHNLKFESRPKPSQKYNYTRTQIFVALLSSLPGQLNLLVSCQWPDCTFSHILSRCFVCFVQFSKCFDIAGKYEIFSMEGTDRPD